MVEPAPRKNLVRPSDVQAWIHQSGFKPSKVLGQNFLVDENILRIMADTAGLVPDDRVMEIGPGLGVVTHALLERSAFVFAVEKDQRLAAHLQENLAGHPSFALCVADALEAPLASFIEQHRLNKMVANLPYSVGSRVLVDCCMLPRPFERIVVTVQLEVAERLAAKVNTSDYGLLTIWAQLDYEVKIAKRISPTCFQPRPLVTSAIVVMEKKYNRRETLRDPALFDALIKHAFSRRRKQMGSILAGFHYGANPDAATLALNASGIDPKRRPETLAVDDWIKLASAWPAN